MESEQLKQLNGDIEELKTILSKVVRENVKRKISRVIEDITVEIAKLKLDEFQKPNKINITNSEK